MEPPIYMYYHLEGFFQNHRRFVSSRDEKQLRNDAKMAMTAEGMKATCGKLTTSADGRPRYPCGLMAGGVFNDTFALTVMDKEDKVRLVKSDSSADAIADKADLQGKFKNMDPEKDDNQKKLDMWILQQFPPVECVQTDFTEGYVPVSVATEEVAGPTGNKSMVTKCQGYMAEKPNCDFMRGGQPFDCEKDPAYEVRQVKDWGVENGHFINWMRVASLPNFRKLYATIKEPLKAGTTLKMFFQSNFPVKEFKGRKAVVLSTAKWTGGKDSWMGYGYMVVGLMYFVYGCFLGARSCKEGGSTSEETSALLT